MAVVAGLSGQFNSMMDSVAALGQMSPLGMLPARQNTASRPKIGAASSEADKSAHELAPALVNALGGHESAQHSKVRRYSLWYKI
jgi:hypothetical protein